MNDTPERLIRRREVEAIVGLKTTSIYKHMKAGTFPRPVQVSAGAVRWRLSDINAWIAAQTVEPRRGLARDTSRHFATPE